ncbi:MAG: branched-chain amino acid ABC transporter permease [Rhizobiaceae bacterium]|nr:branched-chain amino acid ABC transporter permease [Rhizobiaceae bacterium]
MTDRRLLLPVLSVAAVLAVALGASLGLINTYYVYLANLTLINAIAAVGLVVLSGAAGLLSLATAGLVAIGAYSTVILVNQGLNFAVAAALAPFITMAIGSLMAAPAMRLTGLHLAIVTLAFGAVVIQLIGNGGDLTGGMTGLTLDNPTIFGWVVDTEARKFIVIGVVFLLSALATSRLLRLKHGRALFALKERELMARSLGVNVPLYKLLAFAYSSFLAGIAGALFVMMKSFIAPDDFSLDLSIYYFVMIVVGGITSTLGGVIGAAFITLLPEVLGTLKEAAQSVFGIMLVLVIVFMPGGLVGAFRTVRQRFENAARRTRGAQ